MRQMPKKMGWTVYGIIGFIFAPMGFLFTMIGLVVGQSGRFGRIRWKGNSDPAIFTAVFCGIGGLGFSCSWAWFFWRWISAGVICFVGPMKAATV